MAAAERIQVLVWGTESTVHPKEVMIPVQHEGGLVAGAFTPGQELVGMLFGFPTREPTAMHSQLLATLEEWRGQGIGAGLKWFQRQWCLERGITQVRWTVDPLRAANAVLNIRHLGGISSTYYADYYGAMQGIDAGAPSDRLLIEWNLAGERVAARAQGIPPDRGFPEIEAANEVEEGASKRSRMGLSCARILIRIPENYVAISRSTPQVALDWRMQTRELFQHYFEEGYAITEFTRVGGPAYLLERRSPENEG